MKKNLIRIIGYILLATALAVVSALYRGSIKTNKVKDARINEQSMLIDSLLKRKTYLFDVKLNVTDKSKNTIYGRYNKGHIFMPQEKIYKLEIDSTSIIIR